MQVVLDILDFLEAVFKTLTALLDALTSWNENRLSTNRGTPRHLKKRRDK